MDLSKSYFKISEVAELLEVPATTIRFWESEFKEIKPNRTPTGRRYYTAKDIETLEIIKFLLKEKGLKIEAAREQMRVNSANVSRRVALIKTLREVRGELTNILSALDKRK